eukprot:GILI01044078.1.p2 GENE.GILI01044078.1~~GILI01044078.1.p2  ORF type:complete len:101 (-),score=15.59 GILI01044078.1:580-882(-)
MAIWQNGNRRDCIGMTLKYANLFAISEIPYSQSLVCRCTDNGFIRKNSQGIDPFRMPFKSTDFRATIQIPQFQSAIHRATDDSTIRKNDNGINRVPVTIQ